MTTLGRSGVHDDAVTGVGRAGRQLATRAALPRGRAVVGGLLVAVAAVGLLLAHQAATQHHDTRYLIARRSVDAGDHITAADLAYAPMNLFGPTADESFETSHGLVGSVARVDIAAGELLQRGLVGSKRVSSGPGRRLSLDLPPAQALDGSVLAGDRVDVLGSGDSAGSTKLLARRVLVVAMRHPSGGLGSGDTVRLTLVVANEKTAQAVIDTAMHGKVTLVSEGGGSG